MNSVIQFNQPEWTHVLLSHLPLTGLAVAVAVLIAAVILRNRQAILLGLALVGLLSASAWPVMVFGEQGSKRGLAWADKESRAYLRHHMELGDRWGKLYYACALVSVSGLVLSWKRPRLQYSSAVLAVALAVMGLYAGWIIAASGAEAKHMEFRMGLPPGQTDFHHDPQHQH